MWLFPLTYLIHAAEELRGGFPAWVSRIAGISVTPELFLRFNAMFFVGMVAAVLLARYVPGAGWIAVTLAVSIAVNGLFHLAGTIVTRSYSPGVVTGVLLWVPFGVFALSRMRARLSRAVFLFACLGGVGLQVMVSMILLRSGASR